MAVWLWLLAAGALFVIEMITADLLFASLAISATAAMLTAWGGGGFLAQGIAFAVSALITVFILRPIALREMAKRSPKTATNTDALLGASGRTLAPTNTERGQIRLKGEVWSARTMSGSIPQGRPVTVVSIDGATAIVQPEQSPPKS